MTAAEFVDYLFGVATGWLGWPPDVALNTPIPQIYLALRARVKWLAMCNGQADEPAPTKTQTLKQQLRKLKALRA